jgi:hypothetical protein
LELFTQMSLTLAGDLQLRVRLSAPDLAGAAMLACFILPTFRGLQCLPRTRHDCFVRRDRHLKFPCRGDKSLDPRVRRSLTLQKALDQCPRLCRFSYRPLVLPSEGSRQFRGLAVDAGGVGNRFLRDDRGALG